VVAVKNGPVLLGVEGHTPVFPGIVVENIVAVGCICNSQLLGFGGHGAIIAADRPFSGL
jgi:hypothetical protein